MKPPYRIFVWDDRDAAEEVAEYLRDMSIDVDVHVNVIGECTLRVTLNDTIAEALDLEFDE